MTGSCAKMVWMEKVLCMAWKGCMYIKKTTHLLTFLHTAYYEGSNFRFLYRGARREFRQSSDKPPPARSEIDGRFLYVYPAAPSFLRRGKGRFLGCRLKRSFVRCRSPPKIRNEWNSWSFGGMRMWQKNNGHTAKDEIQNHFTGYLLTAIKRKKSNGMKSRGWFAEITEKTAIEKQCEQQKATQTKALLLWNFETGLERQSAKRCA